MTRADAALPTADAHTGLLLRILDEAFDRKGWQGTVLRGSVRGLSAAQAAWRPHAGRHSIRDLVLHCAYWKYTVRRRLLGEKRGSFPRAGSNFFDPPVRYDSAGWKEDVALLVEQHAALRATVESFPHDRWLEPSPGARWLNAQLVYGVAAHDVYHTGQIQLLKRLRGFPEGLP